MRNVITISRQKGSGGMWIAEELARRMCWRFIGKDLISEAASKAGIDEAKMERVFEARVSLQDRITFQQRSAKYVDAMARVMREEVDKGNVVILGRGAGVILAEDRRLFRVHVVADLDTRIQRIASEQKLKGIKGLEDARRLCNESDYARATFHQYLFSVDWNSPLLYELVLNTSDMTLDQASEVILRAFEAVQETNLHCEN
ncbi:MAG TPA: cytidylate kinase-like family protein [Candidatus Anoxymicrobiaceae bacterium]